RRLSRHRTMPWLAAIGATALLLAGIATAIVRREGRLRSQLLEAHSLEVRGRLEDALRLYEVIPDAHAQAARLREAIREREVAETRRVAWEKAVSILNQATPDLSPTQRASLATQALEHFPEYEQAFVVRAMADQELGDDIAAYDDLGRAVRVSPS